MNDRKYKTKFEEEWGSYVASGGYVQIPQDLIRNLGELGISGNEFAVIVFIMANKKGQMIPAGTIAGKLGISITTVRNGFRNLDKRKYIHRFFQNGDANKFSYHGLQTQVETLAKRRQGSMQKYSNGMGNIYQGDGRILHTNKEQLKTNNITGDEGFRRFKRTKEELKNKKKE
jgi:hypothetical protein